MTSTPPPEDPSQSWQAMPPPEQQYGQMPPPPSGQPYPQQPYPQQPYGYPPAPGYGGYPPQQQGNGLAIAGMICGIVGLLVANFILGPLAIVFGAIGLGRANRGAPHRGKAIAGIVLGVADIVVFVILLVAISNSHTFVY